MDLTVPTVMVGCPVRNRDWVLPYYLLRVLSLDYPLSKLSLVFLANDCIDETVGILRNFQFLYESKVHRFCIDVRNYGALLDTRDNSPLRSGSNYSHFARVRNDFVSLLSTEEYILSIDSDLLVSSDLLTRLLSRKVDIVSALVDNSRGVDSTHNVMRWTSCGKAEHVRKDTYESGSLLEVDVTGACYLLSRVVFEKGVRYRDCPQGEDLGFSRDAQEKGFKLFCDTGLCPFHAMTPKLLSEKLGTVDV